MHSSPSIWFAIVCGVIGCALLITGTFTGFWLHISARGEDESATVIFGLFSYCYETLNVPQKCASLNAISVSTPYTLAWRVCAIASWLALGWAVICCGCGMRATGRRGIKRVALILSVKSLVEAVIVIGVFTIAVEQTLSLYSYILLQGVDVNVTYGWSFYLFITGTGFGAVSTLAIITSVVTDPPAEVNPYPPRPFFAGAHLGGSTTQFQPGPGDAVYGYDQRPAYHPGGATSVSAVPTAADGLALAKHAAPTVVDSARDSKLIWPWL